MISILLGENSLKLPQDSGVAYKYIYSTTTTSLSGSPTSWQARERPGPSLRETGKSGSLPDCSRRERSKIKLITQGLYRKKLAFIDAKTLCQQGLARGGSLTSEVILLCFLSRK